jgi:hypothetical protein
MNNPEHTNPFSALACAETSAQRRERALKITDRLADIIEDQELLDKLIKCVDHHYNGSYQDQLEQLISDIYRSPAYDADVAAEDSDLDLTHRIRQVLR